MSSEVQSRSQPPASRGRGGGRGGRGGFTGRGGASTRRANGGGSDAFDNDDSDVVQLRKLHGDKLDNLKSVFPDWSDADILYALQEADGDMEIAATRISEGQVSQWGEVSKQKKTTNKAKPKDATAPAALSEAAPNTRATRGRPDAGRGGRGARGSERARGAGRGRATTHVTTNGHRAKENEKLSVPTDESSGWGNATTNDTATTEASAPVPTPTEPKPAPAPAQKTWASMLRQSTAPPKSAPKPQEQPPASEPEPAQSSEPEPAELESNPVQTEEPPKTEAPAETTPPAVATPKVVEPEVALPPPEDDLTKVNLELLPDESHPPGTATVASTAADSFDSRQPRPTSATATPLSASHAQHARPAAPSGFAATAIKATERPAPRAPSYTRRILDQEEAVRMPGNREVDRAAVRFGAFSLNGAEDDVDGDREEPETRTQPPQESPAAPRASLPPVAQPAPIPDAFSAQKPTAVTPVAPPTGPASATAQPPQGPSGNPQPGRFGQNATAQDGAPGFIGKPYDNYGQQNATPASAANYDSFPAATSQAPGPNNAFSSAPGDYSSYYTADQQTRNAYNNYYGQHYGQPSGQGQDTSASQSRGFSGYNASQSDHLSQYPQSGAQPSRFGATAAASADAQNSGHNTPNPAAAQHQPPTTQAGQPQSGLHQQQQQQAHANQYPYGHPYYSSPFYAQYMNQYGAYNQGGYGGGPYGKGGVYGQPQYGMNPQGPYDHSSSPAASSAFAGSSLAGRDSGLGSSMDTYGRAGSAQSGALGGGGFGGMHDSFARGGSNYPQGGQTFGNSGAQAGSAGAGPDDLKPYGDSKTGAGPSPSMAAAVRPGSATNTTAGASGLPPPQTTQPGMGGYGGYPNHLQNHNLHSNQGGAGYGLGNSGSQGQGNNPYGGYGNQGFGGYYGRQQHQGGWGGNYH